MPCCSMAARESSYSGLTGVMMWVMVAGRPSFRLVTWPGGEGREGWGLWAIAAAGCIRVSGSPPSIAHV